MNSINNKVTNLNTNEKTWVSCVHATPRCAHIWTQQLLKGILLALSVLSLHSLFPPSSSAHSYPFSFPCEEAWNSLRCSYNIRAELLILQIYFWPRAVWCYSTSSAGRTTSYRGGLRVMDNLAGTVSPFQMKPLNPEIEPRWPLPIPYIILPPASPVTEHYHSTLNTTGWLQGPGLPPCFS